MGRHTLSSDEPTLVYMPHCAKPLYESILTTNFSSSLASHVLLGNDLADYVPDLARPSNSEFTIPKKKRNRSVVTKPQDSVLRRLGELMPSPMLIQCPTSMCSPCPTFQIPTYRDSRELSYHCHFRLCLLRKQQKWTGPLCQRSFGRMMAKF